MLTKQEILLGKGTRVESSRVRECRRTALAHNVGFYGDGILMMETNQFPGGLWPIILTQSLS